MRDDSSFVKFKCLYKEKEVFHTKDSYINFGDRNLIIYANSDIEKKSYAIPGRNNLYETNGLNE